MQKILAIVFAAMSVASCHKQPVCETGFTGCDCNIERRPTKMSIGKITLLQFPGTRTDGGTWEPLGLPDLKMRLEQDTVILWTSAERYDEAVVGQSYDFVPSTPLTIEKPSERYRVFLFDFDSGLPDGLELMGGIEFTPYQANAGFPAAVELSCTDCSIRLRLDVTYTFD